MSVPTIDQAVPKLTLIADQWGDPTPSEVYAAISKPLVQAGAGDLEIYEAFSAVQAVFTKVYEMQQRLAKP